jgi:hypothetical protein
MELRVLLDNHTDTESLGLFLKDVNGLPLLTELIRRTDEEMALIEKYNNGLIEPWQCFAEHSKRYVLLMPVVRELILNAHKNNVRVIPIGSDNYNLFNDPNYTADTNREMLGYIKDFLKDNDHEAAIVVGAKHYEIINELVNYAERITVFWSND